MRIAWLGKKSPFCGNVSYGLAVTEALKERGHGISFIHFNTPSLQANSESHNDQEPEVALPYLVKSQMYTIPSPRASRELRESLERFQPDLVHASLTLSPLDFRLPELCQQLGVPLVATFHPPFDAGLRNITAGGQQLTYQLYASSLAKFDRVVVFSELQAELLIRLGVAKSTLAVIPNGVDPNIWRPGASQLSERFRGKRVFLYMGRLATEKNVEALLRAWKLVQLPGCVLVVVGDGPLRQALQANYSNDDVIWWGYEADQAVRLALLQVAEVFMLPSLVEGLSLALLEAMASGTACVATDAGADGEVLEGGAGIVISTQGVTTQLRTLLPVLREQPILSRELGRRARERVLERYTLKGNIDALEQLYTDLISPIPLAA
ncbi:MULTISPECIES: glycosyltransferase family 4 protein [Synechococcus]|jgi:glycosyltransferase involved in cell wall biosynthesis|uniref:Glycosyltransferase n=3 Tax=Synechococcus TaxID=1129 RepID=A0A2P7EGY7_9SYNE|nr:glycosyltransferase family 4 protein [Synechococcus lacustris]NBO29189.1 glycosyltransferase family 1 protein [Synechococcaceae bacterium WB6_1A_059]NBP32823.1 glycosyltransferase family 1 protein [Synechococcaceae bacterium WB6_1B_055]NBP98082.1 glycosyltransferase family 1 protein [Synechococcaceae bacterium WB6_3A_227]NBQ19164.1 glycosyltransferase family 1 protein [Synechococcaceae bacterium WB5_2A_257]NBR45101.1 glycosyltransferase family 1 protein [Synechococcaceae bacterium WB5_2B_26